MEKKKNPILDVTCEFRFETNFPQEAAYAMLLKCFTDDENLVKDFSIVPQPVLNLPLEVRRDDQNLRFVSCYTLSNSDISIGISSFSVSYTKKNYLGFEDFRRLISTYNSQILRNIKEIKQIRLRYVNKIDDSLLDSTNLVISIGGESFEGDKKKNFTINIEDRPLKDYSTILRLNNLNASFVSEKSERYFSVVDIDAIWEGSVRNFSQNDEILVKLNDLSEKKFTNLMKSEYLKMHFEI